MDNNQEKKLQLSHEQERILNQLKMILKRYNLDLSGSKLDVKEYEYINNKIFDFGKELESKGVNPKEYVLWHELIGSTLPEGISEFDTPNSDFEKFILETFAKYIE